MRTELVENENEIKTKPDQEHWTFYANSIKNKRVVLIYDKREKNIKWKLIDKANDFPRQGLQMKRYIKRGRTVA